MSTINATRITDLTIATQVLTDLAPERLEYLTSLPCAGEGSDGDLRIERDPCRRCGGTGMIENYRRINGGICFECEGINSTKNTRTISIIKEARRIKSRHNKAVRDQEAQNDIKADRLAALAANFPATARAFEVLAESDTIASASRTSKPLAILADLKHKAINNGWTLSDAQHSLAVKLASDITDPEPTTPTVPAPEGRQTITGVLRTTKAQDHQYGTQYKCLIAVPEPTGEYLVWTTIPESIFAALGDEIQAIRDEADLIYSERIAEGCNSADANEQANDHLAMYNADTPRLEKLKGRTVTMTVTLNPISDRKEPHFALGKRPSKATLSPIKE